MVHKLEHNRHATKFISALFLLPEGTDPKIHCLRPVSKSTLPMFASRIFMVWGLTFSSLIHFEFIFYTV